MSLADRLKYAEMKARHEKRFRPWYKKWWGISILVLVGLTLAGLASAGFYVYSEIQRLNKEESQNYLATQRKDYENLINGPGGYTVGSLDPKITIIEFTDFACLYCKQSAQEIRTLINDYKDRVKLVVRDYPIHDNSIDLALAARCAGEQGKYWEAYDYLFAEQDNLKDTGDTLKANLLAWAEILQLDTAKFENCFTERRYVNLIKRDYDDGNKLKINGTPTWFINYYPITGYYSVDKFKGLLDGLLLQIK